MILTFSSEHSIGQSILTLDDKETLPDDEPCSISAIAEQYDLDKVILVDESFSGFFSFYEVMEKLGKQAIFGLKLKICADIEDKSEESLLTESNVIIFIKNSDGYKDLCRISTKASVHGFYYTARLDWKLLNSMMTPNLMVAIPFYSSFIARNTLNYNHTAIPIFDTFKPVFFWQNQEVIIDEVLKQELDKFIQASNGEYELLENHHCYYYKKEDGLAHQVLRCIKQRTTIEQPNLDYYCSNAFSFEDYLLKQGKNL